MTFFLSIFFALLAHADGLHGPDNPGYNRPDPPNTLVFDRVPLRVVKAPALKVPEGCDSSYRAGMEDSFRKIWQQCQEIGKTEPSDCQRTLFSSCTKIATDLQKMEVNACTEMHGEKDALDRIRNPDNQKNSQVSSADLNRRAAKASRRVSDALQKSASALAQQRQAATMSLKANACAFSSAARQYHATESKLIAELAKNEKFVKAQADAKKAAADQFDRLGGKAATSASQLKSTVAVNPSNQASTNASTIVTSPSEASGSTYTVTENRPVITPTVQTIVTTSTVITTTESQTTVVYPKPAPYVPVQLNFDDDRKPIPRWVPILAIGVPAAVLAGLAISKLSKSNPGGGSPDAPTGGNPGGVDPGPSNGGNLNPTADPVPGGGDLRSLDMRIDPSFTDAEKSTIAAAVQRIPACYRYKLRGLEVRSADLGGRRAQNGRCVAGTFVLGGNTVKLDGAGCVGIRVGITVHEFFHVIGNRNGNALHSRYQSEVTAKNPSCPVSRYGATNFYEDFAEAGRIVTAPDRDRNAGACVDARLGGMRQILASCQ